jgi:glycosyltransferase involved in cell wall biosynthesis
VGPLLGLGNGGALPGANGGESGLCVFSRVANPGRRDRAAEGDGGHGAPGGGGNAQVSFPAYRESSNKFYVPHYYGLANFGAPKEYKISEGDNIDLDFAGTLREGQIPVVETYHTFFEDYLHHYLPWIPKTIARGLARQISKKQCNQVDAIVAPSQPMLDVLRSYGVTAEAEVIATGLQDNSFAKADGNVFRNKYGITIDRPMMLYVGRVAFEKNIDFLLEVTQKVIQKKPDILMVITGEGPAEKSLHAKARALGIENSVQFIGYLDRNTELNACYQSADIFVFASKSETQGLVLLEAMAQGTPVVAIAELGTASILVEGQGARIATDNVTEFADKVHGLITQPKVRKQLGIAGKAYASSLWSAGAKAEQMVYFYQDLIIKKKLKKSESTMQVQVQA